jgi:branched-chain amino acid transport system substrate-binding protein
MKNKKILSCVIGVVVIGSFLLGITSCKKKEPETIKIGAILPLTGSASEIGEQHKMGLMLAVDEINSQGGINGKKLEIIYEDDKNDPKEAVSAFNKLANIDKVPIVITAMSASSMAIYPIAEQKKIVLFANCGHPEITMLSDWVFRNFPTSKHEAQRMASFVWNTLKIKNLAILYINDAFGEAAMKEIKKEFESFGGKILAIEPFEKDKTDFRSQIMKVLQLNPEAIYVYGYGKANGLVVRQIREFGYKGPLLGSYNFSVEPTLSIAKSALEGSYFTEPAFDPSLESKEIIDFVNNFKQKYNKLPYWNTVIEYDAVNLIAQIIKNKGSSSDKIKSGLENYGDFKGVAGEYKVVMKKEWVPKLSIKTFRQGKIMKVEE